MKGIYFDNIHSFEDLKLILTSTDIPPAEPKTNFIDIPGGDGSLDLTEALGDTKFEDRKCTFTFTVFPGENPEEKKREVSNLLNGRRCKIILDKDPGYYWSGRCAVDKYKTRNVRIHEITIKATVSPYKLKTNVTKITVPAGEKIVKNIWNDRKTVVPVITNTAKATIMFNGGTYTVEPGNNKVLNIQLREGANKLIVTSSQPVIFTYQEGAL